MNIQEAIYKFFQEKNLDGIQPDTELLDSGMVDSLFALEMVMYLEKTFRIRLKDRDITKENFHTVNAMVALVERTIKK